MSAPQPRGLMTRKAAAAYLGVSPETVRRWARQGLVTRKAIGNKLYYVAASVYRLAEEAPARTRR